MALTMFKNFQPPHLQICGSGKLLGALELKQYCCFLQEFAGPGLSALLSLVGPLLLQLWWVGSLAFALPWKTSGSVLTELLNCHSFFLNLKLLWMAEICEGVVC